MSVSYVKVVKQEVFSIGFSVTVFNTATKKLKLKEQNEAFTIKDKIIALGAKIEWFENKIVIKNISCANNTAYSEWCLQQKEQNLLMEQQLLHKKERIQNFEKLKQELLSFNVSNSTPLQAMEFLLRLQKNIKN